VGTAADDVGGIVSLVDVETQVNAGRRLTLSVGSFGVPRGFNTALYRLQ
jgi:hypothetical protein